MAIRVHITLSDDLVRKLDARVGARRRSGFIAKAVEHALEDQQRWELIESALGAIAGEGHDWDAEPATWLHKSRRGDRRRVG
jgi:predicted transcriptional regulator